jgi:succinyl-CoA synthetase beta subunit
VDTVAETAVGCISGHFGSAMSTLEAFNDSVEHGDRLASHQNRLGRGATGSTPKALDFISSHDNVGVSKVDCS